MLPLKYVPASSTLYLAFGDRPDYTVLYAIERMLGCRTEPCLALPGFVRAGLEPLAARRRENEIGFARVPDDMECARFITSYCERIGATEIRLAACGPHLWIRLLRSSRLPLDLVLRASEPHRPQHPRENLEAGNAPVYFKPLIESGHPFAF